jgi:hypothetical protein
VRRLRISPLALGALLILAGLNALTFAWLLDVSQASDVIEIPPIPWTPGKIAAAEAGPPMQKSRDAYPVTLSRPIFFKDRRPYVAPPPPPPPPPPAPVVAALPPPPIIADPGFKLAGIVITDERKLAFLSLPSQGAGNWVSEGEEIAGWQVRQILPERVTLQQGGQSIELLLYKERSTP